MPIKSKNRFLLGLQKFPITIFSNVKNKHEQPIINCLSAFLSYININIYRLNPKKLYWRVSVLQKKGEHEIFSNKAHEANEKKNEFTLSKNFSKSVWNECKNNKPKKDVTQLEITAKKNIGLDTVFSFT